MQDFRLEDPLKQEVSHDDFYDVVVKIGEKIRKEVEEQMNR